jgi:hypothetical protein
MKVELSDLKRFDGWGASVGLQTRHFPALDIDVEDDDLATAIEEWARKYLGPAPVRFRAGSPRRLMLYRAPAGVVLRKARIVFTYKGQKHAVERLATGQQCVVEGPHPKGGHYDWRNGHPCDCGPEGLTEVNEAAWNKFFNDLA